MISGLLASQTGWSDTGERINRGRGQLIEPTGFVREHLEGFSLRAESVPGFRLHKETMV
jgi:hypothetical protein